MVSSKWQIPKSTANYNYLRGKQVLYFNGSSFYVFIL